MVVSRATLHSLTVMTKVSDSCVPTVLCCYDSVIISTIVIVIVIIAEEDDVDDEGNPKPKKVKFTEGHRLAYVVANIDAEVSVVPRGAYAVTSTHYVIRNSGFGGAWGALPVTVVKFPFQRCFCCCRCMVRFDTNGSG